MRPVIDIGAPSNPLRAYRAWRMGLGTASSREGSSQERRDTFWPRDAEGSYREADSDDEQTNGAMVSARLRFSNGAFAPVLSLTLRPSQVYSASAHRRGPRLPTVLPPFLCASCPESHCRAPSLRNVRVPIALMLGWQTVVTTCMGHRGSTYAYVDPSACLPERPRQFVATTRAGWGWKHGGQTANAKCEQASWSPGRLCIAAAGVPRTDSSLRSG
ncbi:hypothetical protein EVG20_g7848 [Dentipellis fragilis]|uniref:Uncharacterized protein n=1 Tax=Dentipellis fragilis TaxID=205917 RepID=A0A4Y9YCG9_9AGAM|nr:hypothetical protein EVG20_g7848 [Dentipellis fragilis]